MNDLLLPERALLLHVGPHKTGTTSIQFALHTARSELARRRVVYAGSGRHAVEAAQAVRGLAPLPSHERGLRQWRGLVREARAASASRVVLSSEWYAEATPAAIERIVDELGADRVHVVVTLRPLAAILPSQWQQYVQGGVISPYEEWLHAVLNPSDPSVTSSFWRRHRHDELVARWASVLGPHRVSVIVIDERDHRFVLRAFEAMLGLPGDALPLLADRSNRSLTRPEIEVLRGINQSLREGGAPGPIRSDLVLFGAAPAIRERRPAPGEPRIRTPDWALERAAQIGAAMAEGIAASGVRVVGDLSSLSSVPALPDDDHEPPPQAWAEIAGTAARGIVDWVGLIPPPDSGDNGISLGRHLRTKQLIGIIARRLRRAARRRLRRS